MTGTPPTRNEGGWKQYLSQTVAAGMTRRQWYALIAVAVGLLWGLAIVFGVLVYELKPGLFEARLHPWEASRVPAEHIYPPAPASTATGERR